LQLTLLCLVAGLPSPASACPNEAARPGASARLPDCRAYELVTPRDTGGALPVGVDSGLVTLVALPLKRFSFPPAMASGGSFVYATFGTALPGTDGSGVANTYRAERGADGWTSRLFGPSGAQAAASSVGGFSSDQGYLAFHVERLGDRYSGSLAVGPGRTSYLRAPHGTFQLVGEGTLPATPGEDGNPNGLGNEMDAIVEWISAGGGHVVFSQGEHPVRLLAESPPEGVRAVYDRTRAGLRLVSVLPGEEPAAAGSSFEGASADGSTILFRSGGGLFARVDGLRTEKIGSGGPFAAGVSDDGRFVFFAEGADGTGNLFRYDTLSRATATISDSGDSTFVNVSADGARAYFASPSRLDGEKGVSGAPNIYAWDGGSPRFVATVSPLDLARPEVEFGVAGLTQWVTGSSSSPARNGDVVVDTSRVTADGRVFVFESTANLTGFDAGGEVEIYRYDDSTRELACVSCGRLFEPPSAGAALADYRLVATGLNAVLGNLSADGSTVFFQSDEPLLSSDVNATTDVYEWHEGTLSLISTGSSPQPSLLMGASADGRNVFFRTAEQLVGTAQQEGTRAIYDARVGGGFPSAPPSPDPCATVLCGETLPGEAAEPEPASALLAGPTHRKVHRRKPCGRRHQSTRRTKCLRVRHHHRRGRG
jgi:hypothetical protein